MGSTSSSNLSKTEKNDLKDKYISNKIEKINNFQNDIINSTNNSDSLINPNSSIKESLIYSECMKTQLSRFDKNFTKADLIAIIMKLKNYDLSKIKEFEKMTCSDLIVIIRGLIYDIPENNLIKNKNDKI